MLAGVAVRIGRDRTHPRRWGSATFWLLLAIVFLFGKALPALASGYLVVAMVVLAAARQVGLPRRPEESRAERMAEAVRLGNRLFWPALLVPAVALVGSALLGRIQFGVVRLADPRQAALVSLGLGAIVALVVGQRLLRAGMATPLREGSRLLETVGWALILPQLLAALGGVFQRAGVGAVVADVTTSLVPTQFPLVAVIAYCVAMALFTMCMGNAFAAFAVITAGIGLPLIVQQHHGNPAIMAAIGMLSGYCGTLMTPMAANFNIVPAMLLELPDKNAVIKAQLPIALALLAANIGLMYLLVYRF
ncbi:DUF979 domain-containing protein [Opitutus sp. ER46]|nr:DUF979 domain-containing protein [Opitutus sp. ER46]